jgi:hypothetical protein
MMAYQKAKDLLRGWGLGFKHLNKLNSNIGENTHHDKRYNTT